MIANVSRVKSYVLLTGATGMVGSHLMARLLARQVPVAVLVRDSEATAGRTANTAANRVDRLLSRFEAHWGRQLKRPVVLSGDINSRRLGLSAGSLGWLRDHCRSVIHSAASLSFRPACESAVNEPYRSNVGGTTNVAEVCADSEIGEFHYISTAYVCGVCEGLVNESDKRVAPQFANDYEQSKLQAEWLLRDRYHPGALTVYRPSIVIDSTGLAPVSPDRTIYSAFSMFHSLATKFGLPQLGTWSGNLGLTGQERKNVVEAAWVAETIAGILGEPQLHGRTYHLTSRCGTPTSEMEKAFHDVTTASFSSRRPVGPAMGSSAVAHHPQPRPSSTSGAGSLTGSAVLDAIAAPFVEAYLPHFRDDPTFGRANLDAALQRLGLPEQPAIDDRVLAEMIRLPGCFGVTLGLAKPEPQMAESAPADASPDFGGVHPTAGVGKEGRRALAALRRTAGFPSQRSAMAWGLVLCGSGGGDYALDLNDLESVGLGGEMCGRRIYLSGDDWEAIVGGTREVEELTASGRLVVEWDDPAVAAGSDTLLASLAQLVARLRTAARCDSAGRHCDDRRGS